MRREASRRSPGDGALFYRADRDRWIGRVTIDGERRTVSAKTKTEARKELDLLRRAADDGLPLTEGSMTVSDLLTAWTDKALPQSRARRLRHHIPQMGDQDPRRGDRQRQSPATHPRSSRGSVPAPHETNRRRQTAQSRSHHRRCAVTKLADQDPLHAQPGTQVGAAPQPCGPQHRDSGRDPCSRSEAEVGQVVDCCRGQIAARRCSRDGPRSHVGRDALPRRAPGRGGRTGVGRHRFRRWHRACLEVMQDRDEWQLDRRLDKDSRKHPHTRCSPTGARLVRAPSATPAGTTTRCWKLVGQ
jgi:hypothetical protein